VDEVKITKSFSTLSKQTPLTGHCPESGISPVSPQVQNPSEKPLTGQCPALPDNVRILNLGPMARFLRELYIYLHTSNGSLFLAFEFFY
jgi:hypothetical protein